MLNQQKPGANIICSAILASIAFGAAISITCAEANDGLFQNKSYDDKKICGLLRLDDKVKHDYWQILWARTVGLPDSTTTYESEETYGHLEYLEEAKSSGWPLNLTDKEYGQLSLQRQATEIRKWYGLKTTASDEQLNGFMEFENLVPKTLRNIVNWLSKNASWLPVEDGLNQLFMDYENRHGHLCSARSVGLPESATSKQIDEVRGREVLALLIARYHLKSDATLADIQCAQQKEWKASHSALLHRIFKADNDVSDVQLEERLKPLAIALHYPIYNRGTDCAGHRTPTFDDLLTQAVGFHP